MPPKHDIGCLSVDGRAEGYLTAEHPTCACTSGKKHIKNTRTLPAIVIVFVVRTQARRRSREERREAQAHARVWAYQMLACSEAKSTSP